MDKLKDFFNKSAVTSVAFASSAALGASGLLIGFNSIAGGDLSNGATTVAIAVMVGGIGCLGLKKILCPV